MPFSYHLPGRPAPDAREQRMYLQDAMALVLREHGTLLHPNAIVAEVNRRKLYTMKDGSPVEKLQIHARVSNYPQLFMRENGLIGLLEW